MCPIPQSPPVPQALRHAALLACIVCPSAHAQALPVYDLDPQHTRVHWEVMHFGTSTSRGRFDIIDGVLRLDRAARRGEVSVRIDTAAVDTGVAPLDGMLRGEHFFASRSFPDATFVSRRLRFEGDAVTGLEGELTLRDVSRPLSLKALHFACRPHPAHGREVCGGDFEGELRRGDFGITYGLPFVADRVRLVVQVEAVAR